jgi:hypothetical protein
MPKYLRCGSQVFLICVYVFLVYIYMFLMHT